MADDLRAEIEALRRPLPNSLSLALDEVLGWNAALDALLAAHPVQDDITPVSELEAWQPNTDGTPAPWREGDCAGHDPDGHQTRWCYCRNNAIRFPFIPTPVQVTTGEEPWILAFDYRSDSGPRFVGPFPTKDAADAWARTIPGMSSWLYEQLARPVVSDRPAVTP